MTEVALECDFIFNERLHPYVDGSLVTLAINDYWNIFIRSKSKHAKYQIISFTFYHNIGANGSFTFELGHMLDGHPIINGVANTVSMNIDKNAAVVTGTWTIFDIPTALKDFQITRDSFIKIRGKDTVGTKTLRVMAMLKHVDDEIARKYQ